MSSLADIRRRLTSVKQTRQITGAMETVSVAKMRKATERLEKCRAYTELLGKMMSFAACGENTYRSPFFMRPKDGKRLVLVLSSDKGLCGGFDHDIFRLADTAIDNDTLVMPIGQTAGDRYKSFPNADLSFVNSYNVEHKTAQKISRKLLGSFGNGVSEISVIYSAIYSRTAWKPVKRTLLPVEKPLGSADGATSITLFEPSERAITETLIPMYVSAVVYGALAENAAAEHSARRAAMSAATESADELIAKLSVEYNRARQSNVTEQIIEIIGSTEALNGQGVDNEKNS